MKRHLIYVVALLMTTSFAACGNKAENKKEAAQSVDAFVKEICNKDNKLKDQSLVYNIYHNQLHRFDKYKQIY